MVLLFNSNLKLFSGKLRSRWSGPFKVLKAFPHGAIEIGTEAIGFLKVNDSKLKYCIAGESIEGKVSFDLPNAFST